MGDTARTEKNTILSAKGICKSFASTKALKNVDMEVVRGEVLGLIGENGSGKSTLSTIIAGIQSCDSGEMLLNGKSYRPNSISDGIANGICIIVQEQGTLNGISVAANIFAGKEQDFSRFCLLDLSRMHKKAKELLEEIGAQGIDPAALVDNLTFEQRKLLEVLRARYNDPQILIVDETTTTLGKEGRSVIYSLMKEMRTQGKSVIFISNDIDELIETCDRVFVLRDGDVVGSLKGQEMIPQNMKKMMVGREVPENMYRTDYGEYKPGKARLQAENLRGGGLKGCSVTLHSGEILGVGGLTDCGMHELGKMLFGLEKPDVGTVTLDGKTEIGNAGIATRAKMGYISKNRDTEALMGDGSIKDNMCLPLLPGLKRFGLVAPKAEKAVVGEWREKLSIKMREPKQQVMQLSGGNKQKVSIAKWLAGNAEILIFDCPTRGIDIGVKTDIYKLIADLRSEGRTILMITEELPELIGMSDRILVMKNGSINGEFMRSSDLTEADLLEKMI